MDSDPTKDISLEELATSRIRFNPFSGEWHLLATSLSPKECAERLGARTLSWWNWRVWLRPGHMRHWAVIGSVSTRGFTLWKTIPYNNSWRPRANGRLHHESGVTHIEVRLGRHPFVTIFELCWFGGVVMTGGSRFVSALQRGSGELTLLGTIAAPVLMLAFGFAVRSFGLWLARNEGAFLLQFLRETMDAEEVRST